VSWTWKFEIGRGCLEVSCMRCCTSSSTSEPVNVCRVILLTIVEYNKHPCWGKASLISLWLQITIHDDGSMVKRWVEVSLICRVQCSIMIYLCHWLALTIWKTSVWFVTMMMKETTGRKIMMAYRFYIPVCSFMYRRRDGWRNVLKMWKLGEALFCRAGINIILVVE